MRKFGIAAMAALLHIATACSVGVDIGEDAVSSLGGTGQGGQTEAIGGSAVFDPIGGKQRCDGDADCFDGSDELDC